MEKKIMDKNAIRKFAVWARRKLIEDIQQKAFELGISEKEIKEPQVISSDAMVIGDRTLNKVEKEQRKSLVSKVKEKRFEQVIEEVAYTWFNRFIALRFMEVNGYLPTRVKVLSSIEDGKKEPDIIREALNVDLDVDRELIYQFQDTNDTVGLYRYLLVKQCNSLFEILPGLFEPIEDYTEILLPSNLLSEGSVIRELVDNIPEDDFKEQVEIIGWMYQYYISEKKDEIFEGLKKNIKITKENIPAATQLFTPDWIVKYMVQNSLGRLWLEGHLDEDLKNKWKYYLEEDEQEPDVQKQLAEIREKRRGSKPEDIKVLDPAMGSGHILVYAFDVLYDIYKSSGYAERDIPKLILKNNLYGLDIDDRASQLAYFAIMMKARSKSRRILNQIRDENIDLNICAIKESNGISRDALQFFLNGTDAKLNADVEHLVKVFQDAKEYGSILDVKPFDFKGIERRLAEVKQISEGDVEALGYYNELEGKLTYFIKQARILSKKYYVVCTNPPYMANKGMSPNISSFVKQNYPKTKSDLFSVFVEKCLTLINSTGHIGMMTSYTWMFLSSYSELRFDLIKNHTITSLVQPEYHAFFEEAYVPICSFTLRNNFTKAKGEYIKLTDFYGAKQQPIKLMEAILNRDCGYRFSVSSYNFLKIDGAPIAYWISKRVFNAFSVGQLLTSIASPKQGIATTDNNRFVRAWNEVDFSNIGFGYDSKGASTSGIKWFPINKGGEYRKWFGNNEFVVNYQFDGKEIKENVLRKYPYLKTPDFVVKNQSYYFKENGTWSAITSGKLSVRYSPQGFIPSNAGMAVFEQNDKLFYIIALLNSKCTTEVLIKSINESLNYNAGDIERLPVIISNKYQTEIESLVKECIGISKTDWDSLEVSWDFEYHPYLQWRFESKSLAQIADLYNKYTLDQFGKLKRFEEKLNEIFIEIYGFQEELLPELDDRDITIHKADRERDIKSFISYAVGCIFGRYSLDINGLVYAGGEWVISKYRTFVPGYDNIVPITDDEYFDNDVVSKFVEFVKVAFSEETLEENLDYIADSLGRKGSETSRQTIRRYFLKDFYKDHTQTYKKRPIYWLFDAGKQDGFKALIYMHRYDEFTVARVRTDYLHKLQKSYEAEIKRLNMVVDSNTSEREKANSRKKKEKILKQMEECLQYDQVIAHVANQRINIDLDDGVTVNYDKFQGVEIPQGEGKKPLKANLLAKI